MIVLDTNVLSEEMKPAPEPAVHLWLARQNPLGLFTTVVTEAEILCGSPSNQTASANAILSRLRNAC